MPADGWRDRGWPDPAPTPAAHTHALADLTDITAQGIALVNDATAGDQRTTLGLGTLATQSGTFSGTSSGTNTGDQTITLTGDVTGSGTGSFAATVKAGVTIQTVIATTATVSSGTTTIPYDNTIPQKTEGDEYLTGTITCRSASSVIKITFLTWGSTSATAGVVVAAFQDTTSDAIAGAPNLLTIGSLMPLALTASVVAGTTSATTIKIRMGPSTGTFTHLGTGGSTHYFSASGMAVLILEEIAG